MRQDTATLEADAIINELMSPQMQEDPYPLYDRLRELAPNHMSGFGVRFVSTHALCTELMRSKDFGQSFGMSSGAGDAGSTFLETVKDMLILMDPPNHTRIRKLVTLAFSARMIQELTPRIRERIEALLDGIAEAVERDGKADLVEMLAVPLPSMVLGEMLGAPPEDSQRLRAWEEAIADAIKPILAEDLVARADRATTELHNYIRTLIDKRRREPGTDIVSVLTKLESEGDSLSERELLNVIFTIMAAGSQTTTSALTSMVWHILRDREHWERLRREPELIGNALDEDMRLEAPLHNSFMRIALRPSVLGGEEIAAGEHVVALFAAANRDPRAFDNPDALVLDRDELIKSFTFGAGIHLCLGRALGRQEVILTVEALLQRFPDLQLCEQEFVWRRLLPLRQLDRLYVQTDAKGTKA
jgi:cytochrome P450